MTVPHQQHGHEETRERQTLELVPPASLDDWQACVSLARSCSAGLLMVVGSRVHLSTCGDCHRRLRGTGSATWVR